MTDTTVHTPAVATDPILSVEDLHVSFGRGNAAVQAVAGITFSIRQGETLGLVGESGCGKSTIALSIVRYLARNGRVSDGTIEIDGTDVLSLNTAELRQLRARTVSMVYQEPGRALNPSIRVGRQIAEVFDHAPGQTRVALYV